MRDQRVCQICGQQIIIQYGVTDKYWATRKYCSPECSQLGLKGKPRKRKPPSREAIVQRFWAKVQRGNSVECWPWIGARQISGYGFMFLARKTKLQWLIAHRFSYELHHGPIPAGLQVCHHCDNPPCVNPDHLFLGTIADNMTDRDRKGRNNVGRGERQGSAKLKDKDIPEIRALRAEGWSQQRIANAKGVSQVTISKVLLGQTWTHVLN